jgi:hypothetical protein
LTYVAERSNAALSIHKAGIIPDWELLVLNIFEFELLINDLMRRKIKTGIV